MNNIYLPTKHKIIKIHQESSLEWLFEVEYNQPCLPGQFVQVSIPKVGEAPISITKTNKNENTIELLIRKVGKVTSELFCLKENDYLSLRGPYGNAFLLDEYEDKEIILISGGSGIAPVRPLIKHFYKNTNFRLLCGFKDKDGILFSNEIKHWQQENNNIHITLDCDNDVCLIGFVTDHLDRVVKDIDLNNCVAIIVGPPLMMKYTTLGLLERGIKEEDIIVSFERNMSCAVGKCGHCKIDETYVCLEGPVFNYSKAKKLLD